MRKKLSPEADCGGGGYDMKKMHSDKLVSTLFLLFPTVLLSVLTAFAHEDESPARGEAFSDPSYHVAMPRDWVTKSITYDSWAEKQDADIAISLEQDVYQTILPLIQRYAKQTGLKIAVKEGTCGIAAGMLAKKTVDIGGFCCPAGKEDRLPGLRYHTLGIVGKAFFVHPDNPIDSLTVKQLTDIYRGKIYRWSELKTSSGAPGPNLAVRAIARLHCQLRPGHWRLMLDNDKDFGPRMNEVGSVPDMISQVGTHRDAIGWEVLVMLERYKELGPVKPIKVNGASANDPEAVASLRYPYYRVYNITTWEGKGLENVKARKLVEYLLKEAERLDPSRYGFISPGKLRKAGWNFSGDELSGEPALKEPK
jgi:phosphate transport system substrate-binding protein